MNDGFLGILRLVSVAIQNVGFAVIVGALLSNQWLARGASTWQDNVGQRLVTTLRIASIVSMLASMLSFWAHCALMSDSSLPDAGPAVWSMLEGTGFGHAWLIGAFFTLCIIVLSWLRSGGETRFPYVMWVSLAGVALSRSNGGHPVDAGLFSLPVWIDWLHLLAISAWVGLVLVTTYIVMPRLLDAPGSERHTSASFVQSLSDAATYALLVLFSTGAYNGWRGVNTPANVLESTYGQVLLLKLALVLIAAVLGGHNRFFEMPKLLSALKNPTTNAPTGLLRRFGAVLHVESIVLAGVLMVAAVLVSSPLPGTT
ncbi:TPA: copper resistance D family protein [Burkholderia contaminans]|uniref:copper resistance D family protein n=1 Tax=Burkholderia cepacia complex TaxID=87882 RepID=UPI00075E2C87|nr:MULTISPECIES: CopD family protein [Burkholderia cepacia complex]KVS22060.1 copper resistance protein CopD [Burkholderia vietnamiensis]MBM6430574.1 CopD family protein [Burkholderia contaminans]MCA7880843.1 CopD family protein [Burkholderia contaminans]MCB4349253.1 CopD family protein [Burkholderia vietnamiensis]MDN8025833.1 CopD family protein [Burkholderia contaminans]